MIISLLSMIEERQEQLSNKISKAQDERWDRKNNKWFTIIYDRTQEKQQLEFINKLIWAFTDLAEKKMRKGQKDGE